MSIFPIDLDRYKAWTIEQLYYLLFPYIKEDFMGKRDCKAVHTTGNMIVTTSDGPLNVTHTFTKGGSDTFLSTKETEYRTKVEEGSITLQSAQETGEFNG